MRIIKNLKNSIFKKSKTTSGSASATLVILGFLIIGLAAALSLVPQKQEIREKAAETTSNPAICGNGDIDSGEICDTSKAGFCQEGCEYRCLSSTNRYEVCKEDCSGYSLSTNCYSCGADNKCLNKSVGTMCESGKICNNTCQCVVGTVPSCGNGVVDTGEICDPGKQGTCQEGCEYRCSNNVGHYEVCKEDCSGYRISIAGNWCSDLCGSTPDCERKGVGNYCAPGKTCNEQCQCVAVSQPATSPAPENTPPPTPASFSCQGLVLNGKPDQKIISISLGETVNAIGQISNYGMMHYKKVDDYSGRVYGTTNPPLDTGTSPLTGLFKPTEAGIYVVEINAYDSDQCQFLCSAGGVLYRNTDGLTKCQSQGWEESGSRCVSNNCIKYVTVGNITTPTTPPTPTTPSSISSNTITIEFVDSFPAVTPGLQTCSQIKTENNKDYALCSVPMGLTPGCGSDPADHLRSLICYYNVNVAKSSDCPPASDLSKKDCRHYNRRACGWNSQVCNTNCSDSGCNFTFCNSLTLNKSSITVGEQVTISTSFQGYGLIRYAKVEGDCNRVACASNPQTLDSGNNNIEKNFTLNDPGLYAYEVNVYDSNQCNFMCSSGGMLYQKPAGGTCITGNWETNPQVRCKSNCLVKYLQVNPSGAAQNTPTPASFSCQSLTLNNQTGNITVNPGETVNVKGQVSHYGLIACGETTSLTGRVGNSPDINIITRGVSSLTGSFTPTKTGIYVCEINAYESDDCQYHCSAGGILYLNSNNVPGPSDCAGDPNRFTPIGHCTSNSCIRYITVGNITPPQSTPTPRITAPPPTIILTPTPNPNSPILKLKINFFGVYSEPDNPSDLDYKNRLVRVIINKANLAGENAEVYRQSINFKAVTDGDQFYYKNTDLINPNIPAGKYNLFLKGPQHLQVKKKNVDLLIGMTYTYDFSAVAETLPGGELPLPIETTDNVVILTQDGVVNSLDYGFIVNSFNKTDHDVLLVGDLNLDGIINAGDTSVLAHTLEEKLDEDE